MCYSGRTEHHVEEHVMNDELEVLRTKIRAELMATKVVQSLFNGAFDADAYARYLRNVYAYAQHSPKVMALAAARCSGTHPELAAYLLQHAREEMGHDRWALDDLRDLGISEDEVWLTPPVPACETMISHMYYTAEHANPIGLFGWMYILEVVGSDLGGAVAAQLERATAASANQHRFVARHGVTDVDHTEELTEQIVRYVQSPEDQMAVTRVAEVTTDLYARMFREIGGEQPTWV
jgi:thiaminase